MEDTAHKAQLMRRLEELGVRLRHLEDDLVAPHSPDAEDRATEREDDEVKERLGNAGLAEANAIRDALRRMDAGTYGRCTQCGEEISAERLDIVPHTALCRRCAAG